MLTQTQAQHQALIIAMSMIRQAWMLETEHVEAASEDFDTQQLIRQELGRVHRLLAQQAGLKPAPLGWEVVTA